ncbi:Alpha/Beta hydrolase protein [Mortierella sp. GBAus27b]|nr:Alpha/Beta hydrolase protein [Mortierella sp. GBAus27b]
MSAAKQGGYLRPGPIESFSSKGLKAYDYYFDLPLKHTDPACKDTIVVFARKVIAIDKQADSAKMPWLIFFQGGPGFQGPAYNTGWVKMAASKYNVLLLDQRGTGLSTPMTVQMVSQFKTPQEQADYFMQFRADSIVRDSELIRETLLANCEDKKWSLLGQSYGGFCITTYLSMFPESITAAYITGGIPPAFDSLDDVYRKCYRSVMEHTERYYKRFPLDIKRVKKIMKYLASNKVQLPSGGLLTPRKFQQLGMRFGLSGGMDYVHSLCLQAFVTLNGQEVMSSLFLDEMASQDQIPPIYAILHESIYCDGPGVASNWTASKLLNGEFKPSLEYSVKEFEGLDNDQDRIVYFTGEHMYDWMLDDYASLAPLKECADILAKHDNWPKLYNAEVLAKNTVPVAAAVYYDDMYVARECSEKTAKGIKGIQLWVTNEYMHSGLRDNEEVLGKLFKMVSGEIDVPVA